MHINYTGIPSTPTVDSMEYSVVNSTTGRFRLLVSSSGTFGTKVTLSASVVGGSGTVVVTDNMITVIGLSYTGSHTVSVLATSAVCPGVDNSSIDVPVVFNIRSEWTTCRSLYFCQPFLFLSAPVLIQPTGFVDCSNPSLPISGSWSLVEPEGVSVRIITVQIKFTYITGSEQQ